MAINFNYRFNDDGYNLYGYNRQGFHVYNDRNREGYDEEGLDRDGYNRRGYDRDDHSRLYWDRRYMDAFDEPAFFADGFDLNDYNRWGYDRHGFNWRGWDCQDYDSEGYNIDGYNRAGLDRNGYNRDGDFQDILDIYWDVERNPDAVSDEEEEEDVSLVRGNQRTGILSLSTQEDKLVLDFNTDRGDNYELKQNRSCNADVYLNDGAAFEVHRLFNKEKKIFMILYNLLEDKHNVTTFTTFTHSFPLFIEIQRLFNQKLYSIKNTLHDYNIKISILIKVLRKLLEKIYDLLIKPRIQWENRLYCDQNRGDFLEAICDYSKKPPQPLPSLMIWDLYLRYIKNLCLLNDKLFTDIIIDYGLSNIEAYRDGTEKSLETLNSLLDIPREGGCDKGWIERLILCTNDFIKKQQFLKGDALELFKGTTMLNLVCYLIKDIKKEPSTLKVFNKDDIDYYKLINEFKLSQENNSIIGDLKIKKEILKNKIFSFIVERLSKIYIIEDIETDIIRENIRVHVDEIDDDNEFDEGKYKKKYLKYKNKYLNLKNKFFK